HTYSAEHDLGIKGQNYTATHSNLSAQHDTYVTTDGNIDLKGTTIQSQNYVQLYSKGNITNEAIVQQIQGQYDVLNQYICTQISGGKGEGHDGNGVVIKADGQFVNIASNVAADGNVNIKAEQNVQIIALTHEYVSYEKHEKHGIGHHKEEDKKTTSVQVEGSDFVSNKGSVSVISNQGAIYGEDAHFQAATGAYAIAKGKVNLVDVVTTEHTTKKESSGFGASHSKSKHSDQISTPTTIKAKEKVHIESETDDVVLRGVVILSPGDVYIQGNNVDIGVSVLEHTYSNESSGFSASMFGQQIAHSNVPSTGHSGLNLPPTPTINHASDLAHANNFTEAATSAVNTAVDVANDVNTVVSGVINDNLASQVLKTENIGLTTPSITCSYTHSKSEGKYETEGAGGIYAGSLTVNAKNKVTIEGPTIATINDATINADIFEQKGVTLHSESEASSETVSVSFSAAGDNVQVGASGSIQHSESTTVANEHMHVGGTLHVNAKDWNMKAANVDAEKVDVHVDKLTVESVADTASSSSTSASASTNGAVSFSHESSSSTMVNSTAGINVHEAVTQDNFQVNTLHTIGAAITSDTSVDINPDVVIADSVHEDRHSTGFSASGNVHDFIPEKQDPHFLPPQQDQARQIHTLDVGVKTDRYDADVTPVIHGQNSTTVNANHIQGQIDTANTDGRVVHHDKQEDIKLDIPIYDQKTMEQMKSNIDWGLNKLGLSAPTSDPITLRAFEDLKTPEDVEKYITKMHNYELLSTAAYDLSSTLPDGFVLVGDRYDDNVTDTEVDTFVNEDTKQVIIAFRGTANLTNLVVPDLDIATGKPPRSYNDDMQKYIEDTMAQYPDYDISFTGHSLGAAEASLASSQYNEPAVVFDNPGVYNTNNEYDFSHVTDFESLHNIVNGAGPLTGKTYDKGNVIGLPSTPKQDLVTEAGKALPAPSELVISTTSHQLKNIDKEFEQYSDTLRSQANYNTVANNPYTLYGKSSSQARTNASIPTQLNAPQPPGR
ncbi:MAG: hemagglutinin repeat-containing protein, partial [Gammaproteobacteria bacterium]